MIVLLGASASGKSTLQKALMDTGKFKKIVTYTTRPPRQERKMELIIIL